MSKVFSYKIIPWFSAACLSLLLPFVVGSNAWAQNCTPADVKGQIQKLQDDKGRKAASDVLVKCGESAIASLTQALSDENTAIRSYAASIMGKIGADAQDGVSGLVEALGDSDERVCSNAASALVQIARGVQREADEFTEWDLGAIQRLEGLKQSLEKGITALEKDKREWKSKKKDIENLQLARRGLQTKLNQLTEQNLYQVVKWVENNPWVWLAVGYLVGYLGIFIVRPIWLLKLDEFVKPAKFEIPVVKLPVSLESLMFLKYRPRVLDAWVSERIQTATKEFERKKTVKKHQGIHILDKNTKALKNAFAQPLVRVVIYGEVISAKTNLACQIARWAMEPKKSDRLCQHLMLPILIEDKLDQPLLETINGLLKELIQKNKAIPEELLKQLLRKRRILLIVNNLSEMGEETLKKIQPDNPNFSANALIVTSRRQDILGQQLTPTLIQASNSVDLDNGVSLEMVEIPGGRFMMGSPPEEERSYDNEHPQHQVKLAPFLMGKYPITQAQWQAVAALPTVERKLEPNPSRFQGANRPVERVSWYDAVEFCARLSKHQKQEFRLPSEAEWEYACRARTTTPFYFGDTITSDLANYNANYTYGSAPMGQYREQTTDVGSFPANVFGLYDMHGNVWEWCLDDWHDNYEGAPKDGSAWFDDNNKLSQKSGIALLRGGSWIDLPKSCRSAYRINQLREKCAKSKYYFSFRVVCAFGRTYS